ncbi:polysaccharide biosynthesis/export family protein [Erythrobacter sp. THAF29]|uniref:polysaccharide biosynthesis/export family protein n=1 Tax=Erythrobacter sp. THAF29 TaxID=2587851 RepID=UPI0012AA9E51|nr:polysaccharide biosynthesis/export family protein [Erythrobacter sp. THAF29]QFT77364.1 Polysaccharide biosynthesis/export protein [Erythrobacter sp. THAF29]
MFNASKTAATFALVASACLVATGCATNDLPIQSASAANSEVAEGYFVDAGDQVKITVFDEDTLSGEFEVGSGGTLAMPLIEPLIVKDMTPGAVATLIETKLKEGGFVLYPKVAVEILEHRSFFILGEVNAPGEYAHNGELTLEQAVAKAGGFTPRAEKKSIVLKRQLWSGSRLIRLDNTALKVAPGDTITIRESFF